MNLDYKSWPILKKFFKEKNYYQLLRIKPQADQKEIKQAYYKVVKQIHPDIFKNKLKATEEFIKIKQAYDVLSNKSARHRYDLSIEVYNSPVFKYYW